jgi:hypothetical protein
MQCNLSFASQWQRVVIAVAANLLVEEGLKVTPSVLK